MTKLDGTDPANISNKILTEEQTRARIISHARMMGCEKEMKILFDKFDKMMRNCKNDQERRDMGKLGALEVYNLLGRGGELYVDGQLVAKDD